MPTVMNGVSLNALTTVDTWSALSLFANGEQGAWYDPSDMSTMFQDVAGTIPVTAVEQPVGLILDKSKNLKSVFVGDLPFVSPWLAYNGGTIAGNTVTTSAGDQGARIPTVAGRTYRITANVASISGTFYYVAEGVGTNYGTVVSGQQSFLFRATGGSLLIYGINAGSVTYNSLRIEEIPGNHASQTTDASRPVLSARVNLLTYTEQFDNAAWGKFAGWAVGPTPATDPIGGLTADAIIPTAGTTLPYTFRAVTVPAVDITMSYYVKQGTSGQRWVQLGDANHTNGRAWFDLTNGVPGTKQSGISTSSITPVGTQGWFLVKVTLTKANTSCEYFVQPASADNNSGTTILWNGTDSAFFLWGADLRVTNVGVGLPPYQRVGAAVTATTNPAVTGVPDYDTAGFPLYLKFDGVDDSLATGSIDFTATDKMSVFAGHRIVSGTGSQLIFELGTNSYTSSGFSFAQGPTIATPGLGFLMNAGSGIGAQTADKSVPYTSVSSLLLNSAQSGVSNEGILRSNTTLQTYTSTAGTDSGTANFPNKILYIGNRSGAAVWFNGHLYSLIIRGALSNSSQIENAENYINSKTKAY